MKYVNIDILIYATDTQLLYLPTYVYIYISRSFKSKTYSRIYYKNQKPMSAKITIVDFKKDRQNNGKNICGKQKINNRRITYSQSINKF